MKNPSDAVLSDDSKSPLFSMRGIHKHFGGLQALVDVNLTLNPGEVLGLVGDNGAGKSTLIKVATGVYQPNSGSMNLEGKPVALDDPSVAKKIGIQCVHQSLALADTLGAPENLFLGNELTKSWFGGLFKVLDNNLMRREAAKTLYETLEVELPNPDQPVYYRSGGQKQAIAIARALYNENLKILILDEPTAALGPEETEKTLELVRKLRDKGYGIILVSHNIEEVIDYTDRIMVLWRGQKMGERASKDSSKSDIIQMIMGAKEDAAETV